MYLIGLSLVATPPSPCVRMTLEVNANLPNLRSSRPPPLFATGLTLLCVEFQREANRRGRCFLGEGLVHNGHS